MIRLVLTRLARSRGSSVVLENHFCLFSLTPLVFTSNWNLHRWQIQRWKVELGKALALAAVGTFTEAFSTLHKCASSVLHCSSRQCTVQLKAVQWAKQRKEHKVILIFCRHTTYISIFNFPPFLISIWSWARFSRQHLKDVPLRVHYIQSST